MKYFRCGILALSLVLGAGAGAWAQRMGMGQAPSIPGVFKPVVGSGAEYQIKVKKDVFDWEYAVVGEEKVDGDDGYWMEMRLKGGKGNGMIMKQLMVLHEGMPDIKRMIMQAPGQDPMEMPMGMMGGMMKRAQQTAGEHPEGLGEKIGTESVTVPAGTFDCDHYRTKSGKTTADVWISTKVSPYGMVKMVSDDSTMTLQKVLSDETTQIKGEIKKIEMPRF